MNNYINRVQLLGHLGQDPEVVTISADTSLVKLNLATNRIYKDKNGDFQTKTQWHSLVAWGALGERMAKKLVKGNFLLVSGSLEYRSWESKEGVKRNSTEIRLDSYMHLDKKKATQEEALPV